MHSHLKEEQTRENDVSDTRSDSFSLERFTSLKEIAGITIGGLVVALVPNIIVQYIPLGWLLSLFIVVVAITYYISKLRRFSKDYNDILGENKRLQEEISLLQLKIPHSAGESYSISIEGTNFTFVYCPIGSFTRKGSVVNISNDFWILDVPVTQKMWESVMGTNPSFFQIKNDSQFFKMNAKRFKDVFSDVENTENYPVECVNRKDCEDYLVKLNALLRDYRGLQARLPTRDEWEYACRAGTTTDYSWGKDPDENKGNFNKSVGRTTEVKSYDSNPWNIYDMHGNVDEWTSSNLSNGDGIMCGGSWDDFPKNIRSDSIQPCTPTTGQVYSYMGFRIVLYRVPMEVGMS